MKYFLIFLSLVGIILFMGNYSICMWIYPPNQYPTYVEWWGLKQNIYNVIIAIFCFIAFYCSSDTFLKSILCFTFMACFANIIDRLFFSITSFQSNDIAMLIFASIFSVVFYFTQHNGRRN